MKTSYKVERSGPEASPQRINSRVKSTKCTSQAKNTDSEHSYTFVDSVKEEDLRSRAKVPECSGWKGKDKGITSLQRFELLHTLHDAKLKK